MHVYNGALFVTMRKGGEMVIYVP